MLRSWRKASYPAVMGEMVVMLKNWEKVDRFPR